MMIDMEWDDDIDNYCSVEDDDPCHVGHLKKLIKKSLLEKDLIGSCLEVANHDFKYAFLPVSFEECNFRIMLYILENTLHKEKTKKAISGLIRMAFSRDNPSMFSSLDPEDIIVFLSKVPRPDCFSIETNEYVDLFVNDIIEKWIVFSASRGKSRFGDTSTSKLKRAITTCCTIGRMGRIDFEEFNICDFYKFFKDHDAHLHLSSDSDNDAVFVTRKIRFGGEYHSSKKGHEIEPSEYPKEIIKAARWLIKEELKEETS